MFCGLARNCAHALPRLLEVVASIGRRVQDWAYVWLESDSYDRTLEVLESFDRRHRRGVVRSYGRLRTRFTGRTERLAYLRNQYLDLCESSGYFRQFRHCVVLDLDRVNEDLEPSRILSRLEEPNPDRAGLFANQSEQYYDIWALRHPRWSPDDCWARVRNRPAGMSEEEAKRLFVDARKIRIPSDGRPIEVDSAFGGLGIYEVKWLEGARYRGTTPDGSPVCEHVALHRDIRRRGGRLFIDPSLVNGSGRQEHKAGSLARGAAWMGTLLKRLLAFALPRPTRASSEAMR